MAERASVVALAESYVPSGKEVQAKKIIALLVDSCVKSIGASFRWSWLTTRKDDYSFVPATLVYNLPDDCDTIIRIGKLESGVITEKFDPLDEAYLIDNYNKLIDSDGQFYIPLEKEAAGVKQFRLFPAVSATITARMVYRRIPAATDIRHIKDEMMLVYFILASLPNEMLGGSAEIDVAGKFYSLHQKQWKAAVNMDESSRELDMVFEPPTRAQLTDGYIATL